MLTPLIHRAVAGLLLAAIAFNGQAGSIELSPVRVSLSNKAKVAVLTVRNTGIEESVMQVTLNKWTLDGQGYAYAQSQELVVTPVTFRLAAGAQQIVRVGLRLGAPLRTEAAYRLLVEEVPPPPSADVTQMRMVIRHDLPVFVAPITPAKAALDIAMDCAADGSRLRMTNMGNVHAQVLKVTLTDASTDPVLASWATSDYLLPQAQKSWLLTQVAPKSVGKSFLVTALTDQGSFIGNVKTQCP
ncbi:MAG: fimbria/pilus periplasmic chaperone [Polaromonas sp.]